MMKSGKTEWDDSGMVPRDLLVLTREGPFEKLDYEAYLQGMIEDLAPERAHPYGTGNFFYPEVIAFNTDTLPGSDWRDRWKDVRDVGNVPGQRVIHAGDSLIPPIEYTLISDGVATQQQLGHSARGGWLDPRFHISWSFSTFLLPLALEVAQNSALRKSCFVKLCR